MYEPRLKEKFITFPNVIFMGRTSQEEVFKFIKKSKYAICIIPNKYPYNLQTPTKLLEYLALKAKIITNHNPMVLKMLQETGNTDNVFIMNEAWNLPSEDELATLEPASLQLEDFLWDKILERSGILKEIEERL